MIERRTLLQTAGLATIIGTPIIFQHAPQPLLFRNSTLKWPVQLPCMMLKKMDGMYIGAHRTFVTQKVKLQAMWTFETASNPNSLEKHKFVEDEIIDALTDEIAANIDLHRRQHGGAPIKLVAVDSSAVLINPKTFESVLRFYFEHNEI